MCSKCVEHSTTNATGATSQSQCLVEPGWGWGDGEVLRCEFGFFNEGYNQRPCTYCGDLFNTSATPGAAAGEYGSASRLGLPGGLWLLGRRQRH